MSLPEIPSEPSGFLETLAARVNTIHDDVRRLTVAFLGDVSNPDMPGFFERVRKIDDRLKTTEEYIRGEQEARKYYSRLVVGALITNFLGFLVTATLVGWYVVSHQNVLTSGVLGN